MHRISRREARRIAVRAQWLESDRPPDLLAFVERATLLQLDPTNAIAPSADLVLWSRLGARHRRADLVAAVAEHRLIELDALLRPAADVALYRARMAAWPSLPGQQGAAAWAAANAACAHDIVTRLRERGPLPSRELPDTCAVPWRSTGWTNDRNVTQLLEVLVARGEVAVSGRAGKERLFDLADRVYPDVEPIGLEEADRRRDERRLRSLGIARARAARHPMEPVHVGETGVEVEVEGVKGTWRVAAEELDRVAEPPAPRAALLSPFDRLLHDRRRLAELFEFEYVLEMYKPATQRRWGYYALPVLHGEELVGKLDAVADRKAGLLRVHALHWDTEPDAEVRTAVEAEITALADWLELERAG